MKYESDSQMVSFPSGDFTVIAKFTIESYDRTKTVFSWRDEESMDPSIGWYIDVSQEGKIEAGFGDGLGGKSKVRSSYVPRIGYPCIIAWVSKGPDMFLYVDHKFAGLGQRFDDAVPGSKLYFGSDPYFPTCNFNGELEFIHVIEGSMEMEAIKDFIG